MDCCESPPDVPKLNYVYYSLANRNKKYTRVHSFFDSMKVISLCLLPPEFLIVGQNVET